MGHASRTAPRTTTADDELLDRLHKALALDAPELAGFSLERLPDRGLAHDHVRLCGNGMLARIPKQSQLGLSAPANLRYQCACFSRAAASGHTPRLLGSLPPSVALPRGALLVEEIFGRPAALPGDLPAMANALAAIHRLAVPGEPLRAPLWSPADPLAALFAEVARQAEYFEAAKLAPEVLAALHGELSALRMTLQHPQRPTVHLIAFDGHPGNFILRPSSEAVLVDLEKCRYSYPGLDLAHATLYTSTTWDEDSCAVLSQSDVLSFYAAWSRAVGPSIAQPARLWHLPLRRAMWLWSMGWCAKWRAVSGRPADPSAAGEDWSADRSAPALVEHVRGRVDHYLSAPVVAAVLAEFAELDRALAP